MWSLDLYTYVILLVTWTSHCDHMTMDDIKVHKYFCCIIWSRHTSQDLCIHRMIYVYIAWSMHTSHDLFIRRMIYAYIAWSMHTVHVTNYLNFSAEIYGFPSRNSVNLRKISAERPHPLCKLAAGTYQLQNTFLGIRLSRVGSETVFTVLVKATYSYARLGRHRVVWTRGTRYAIYVSSDLQTQRPSAAGGARRTCHVITYVRYSVLSFCTHRRKRKC